MEQPSSENGISREEIKKEFQLERMILFSDAVFAIAMTLMAMNIKLPDSDTQLTSEMLPKMILRLFPVVLSYGVSFMFIGTIWYQHLKTFSLLKDYDLGLVIRNLVLLFLIGFFPFSASVITQANGGMIGISIYFTIILLCILAQYVLYHYIIVVRPSIRLDIDITEHKMELAKKKISLISFSIAGVLTLITHICITNPLLKPFSVMWIAAFSIVYSIVVKRKKLDKKVKD